MNKVTPSNAKLLINKDNEKANEVAEGFHRLDDSIVSRNAPKIKWGKIYQEFNDAEKIQYLQNLASTMNHAAFLIQNERNDLLTLLEKKEKQCEQAKKAMEQNIGMVNTEITRSNEDRHEIIKALTAKNRIIDGLKKEIRELKKQCPSSAE